MTTQVQPKVKFIGYQTNLGLIYRLDTQYHYSSTIGSSSFKINGEEPKLFNQTKNFSWYIAQQGIQKVEKKVLTSKVHSGWKLLEKFKSSVNFPQELTLEQLKDHWDDDDGVAFIGEFAQAGTLYEKTYTEIPEYWVEVSFETQVLYTLDIQGVSKPVEMKVQQVEKLNYKDTKRELNLKDIACWSDVEVLLTPDFLLHERPCELSSQQMYKIVRQHILDNLSPQFRVTSNYDFCFDVKKVVQIKPFSVREEKLTPRGNSYKPPKYGHSTKQEKLVECFRMTWAGYKGTGGYEGYPCIPALKGDNLQDLADNLKAYLDDLIVTLQTPVKECDCCNGTGHIVKQAGFIKG